MYSLNACHSDVYILRINKETTCQYTTLYYSKSVLLLVSAVLRQPASGCMFQSCKKGKLCSYTFLKHTA